MKKSLLPLLLLSAICITPASANYFSNPTLGINLNVGSAPNPKPAPRVEVPVAVVQPPPPAPPPYVEPPPPVVVAEAPPPPPAPAIVRKFMVFFDFDKSNLTAEARQVVEEAVKTAKLAGIARIVVTGHTDTVGSFRYNQALSERRARSVKNEMVRLGMNAGEIQTVGRSFSDPLIATGPGVREPQNRRAIIDLGNAAIASAE